MIVSYNITDLKSHFSVLQFRISSHHIVRHLSWCSWNCLRILVLIIWCQENFIGSFFFLLHLVALVFFLMSFSIPISLPLIIEILAPEDWNTFLFIYLMFQILPSFPVWNALVYNLSDRDVDITPWMLDDYLYPLSL